MPLIDGFRKLFQRRQEPVEIDLSQHDREVADHEAGPREAASGRLAMVERRPGRNRSMAELQRGYEEVMGLVRKVSDHLDAQSQRTEKLIKLMDRLPQALDSLPEINRQNARLLEVLNDHLSQGKSREEALNATLRSLSDNSGQQTEVLGLLQQQFDVNTQSTEKVAETLGGFQNALSDLATTNSRSADILARIVDTAEEREARLAAMYGRSERWNWVIVGLLALGVVVLIIIGIAMLAQPA